jgi:ABC-type glycerol-3-phosphate transport system substrate-binding protein
MVEKISRRDLLRVFGTATAGLALAACQPKVVEKVVEREVTKVVKEVVKETVMVAGTPQTVEKEVTRVVEVAKAAPATPIKLLIEDHALMGGDQGESPAGKAIRAAFKEIRPEVEIEWYNFPPGINRIEWMQARMTAQDSPHVYWLNTEDLWPHTNKNWALIFDPYLDVANPYQRKYPSWREQFLGPALQSQIGPDGRSYGVCMDGAAVMEIYNKEAFAKAGITKLPETWTEHIATCQALLDAGYIPYGGDLSVDNCCYYHWMDCIIYSYLLWNKMDLMDEDRNWMLTTKEVVIASQKGILHDWDAWMTTAHLMREMAPYLPLGFEGQVDYRQLFRQGKVAMYMEGCWALAGFREDPPPFEFGWIDFPKVTKEQSEQAPDNKLIRIEGAWGTMQYHIPGYLPAVDSRALDATIDWLRFLCQPDHIAEVLKEITRIPLIKDTAARPEMEPFLRPFDSNIMWVAWNSLSGNARYVEAQIWQAYVPTQMSDAEFLTLCKQSWDDELKKVLETNPDWVV